MDLPEAQADQAQLSSISASFNPWLSSGAMDQAQAQVPFFGFFL